MLEAEVKIGEKGGTVGVVDSEPQVLRRESVEASHACANSVSRFASLVQDAGLGAVNVKDAAKLRDTLIEAGQCIRAAYLRQTASQEWALFSFVARRGHASG